jgi:hypothetical protein
VEDADKSRIDDEREMLQQLAIIKTDIWRGKIQTSTKTTERQAPESQGLTLHEKVLARNAISHGTK